MVPNDAQHRVETLTAQVRGPVTVAAVAESASAALAVVPVIATVNIAGLILDGGASRTHLWVWVLVAAVALVLGALCSIASSIVAHRADADLGLSLRMRLAGHLARLPLGWYSSDAAGKTKAVVQDDVAGLHEEVAHRKPELAGSVVAGIAVVVYLFVLDWRLALAVVVLVTIAQLVRNFLTRKIIPAYGAVAGASAQMGSAAVELVQGITVSKVFHRADEDSEATPDTAYGAHARFRRAAADYADADESLTNNIATLRACTRATVAPGTVALIVLALATLLLATWDAKPVNIIAFLLLGLTLFDVTTPLYLNLVMPKLRLAVPMPNKAQAMAERIGQILDVPEMHEPAAPATLPATDGARRVSMKNVSFSYDGQRTVLQGLDLELAPGTMTALVGPSGAGKSTVGQLLARFYDPTEGSIEIDGVPISTLDAQRLYGTVGFVFQDVALLRATVRDNIALARPDATPEDIERVARAAQIHDRILALPDGYDTVLGEDAALSGGERQRLSIARTLLADTPVLVLDEATAYADPESEAAVQDALSELARGRTLLVIAHRLHTVVHADQIAVLVDGAVTERGTHDELLSTAGEYAKLWQLQTTTIGARA
ncbi:ABC transporter ATP-binding protein [Nocardia jiangxiensis]|uniref:ABC transporter ATP-binding protein n=1 Tax=Nocardia jiangxiensis TaxID=282685 RepID=A0ABW6RRX2_9NOCA|nr:ABC transporter ATP-binding protein [Nocardia jiangxiensis]